MDNDLEKINEAIAHARETERATTAAINALGSEDTDPRRDSPTADKIRELNRERKAARALRMELTGQRADALGDAQALERVRKRRGKTGARARNQATARAKLGTAINKLEAKSHESH